MVDERRRQAGRQSGQDIFHWVGSSVLAKEQRRLVGIQPEVLPVLDGLTGAVEVMDVDLAVAAVQPLVGGPESRFGQAGIILDIIDRFPQTIDIDSVDCHDLSPHIVVDKFFFDY
jgi:hypothetical protein